MSDSDRYTSDEVKPGRDYEELPDGVVGRVTRVYKPISTRQYFRLLAYCVAALIAITAVIVVMFNFIFPLF